MQKGKQPTLMELGLTTVSLDRPTKERFDKLAAGQHLAHYLRTVSLVLSAVDQKEKCA